MEGHIPQPMGTLHPNIAPYGDMFSTKDDKYLVLAIGNDKQFSKMCDIIDINPAGYETNDQRLKHREKLQNILQNFFGTVRSDEIEKQFLKENIPFGIVKNLSEVFDTTASNRMIIDEEIDGIKTRRVKTALI